MQKSNEISDRCKLIYVLLITSGIGGGARLATELREIAKPLEYLCTAPRVCCSLVGKTLF